MRLSAVVLVFLACLSPSAASAEEPQDAITAADDPLEAVSIEGETVECRPNAMFDSYEDGHVAFDALVITVVSPRERAGERLTVFAHPDKAIIEMPLCKPGAAMRFDIAQGTLAGDVIFFGALEGLSIRKAPPE